MLTRWACIIEDHYQRPMDIEWAKDGETSELFIVQARPETVQSRKEASSHRREPVQHDNDCLPSCRAAPA
jgi:phosphoenolpyruvate synthase/pyruvate phosphate dikinase